jgi:hypothetical protein
MDEHLLPLAAGTAAPNFTLRETPWSGRGAVTRWVWSEDLLAPIYE